MVTDLQGVCTVRETTLPGGVPAVMLENALISVTVLPGKGADISALVSKPDDIDVLWKSPWGLRRPDVVHSATDSATAWLEAYEGGWQEIFPNGGTANLYRGVELNFHGEASLASWDYEITAEHGDVAEVCLSTRLRRSPFLIERRLGGQYCSSGSASRIRGARRWTRCGGTTQRMVRRSSAVLAASTPTHAPCMPTTRSAGRSIP